MKLLPFTLLFAALAGAAFTSASLQAGSEKSAAVAGSIRVADRPSAATLPSLAKIDLVAATKAALASVPGHVLKAELEVEEGSLVYSVEIVGANAAITEVHIDAGDARVLGTEAKKSESEHGKKEKRRGKHHEDDDDDDHEEHEGHGEHKKESK